MDTLRISSKESLQVQIRPGENLPSLSPGEMVRARVVELMPGGDALLRVKGTLIQAKSDVRLVPDTMVLFRVAEVKGEKGAQQIHLQMIEKLPPPALQPGTGNAGFLAVRELVRHLADLLAVKEHRAADFTATVELLLKALPDDAESLPKELREQILTLLQTGLRTAEQNIQNRLNRVVADPLLQELPEWIQSLEPADGLFAGVEQLRALPFRSLLGRTGVAFEANMQAFAASLPENEEVLESTGVASENRLLPSGTTLPATDLKGKLLDLRQKILDALEYEETGAGSSVEARTVLARDGGAAWAPALEVLEGVLQDIEVYQLLSKVTDSFYTFLPLVWEGLREGEIAFKKSRGGSLDRSYYCLVQLDFEHLGKLTILALKQGGDYFVSFETDHEPLRHVLEENVFELQKMFLESGLNLKTADFHGAKEKHLAAFQKLESFESILSVKI